MKNDIGFKSTTPQATCPERQTPKFFFQNGRQKRKQNKMKEYMLMNGNQITYVDWKIAFRHLCKQGVTSVPHSPWFHLDVHSGSYAATILQIGSIEHVGYVPQFTIPFEITGEKEVVYTCQGCNGPITKFSVCFSCKHALCKLCLRDRGCPDCDEPKRLN